MTEEHRDQNERLCSWLGVEPVVYRGPHGKSHDEQREYPDLATREGFWILWYALIAKGYMLDVWSRRDIDPPIFAEIDREYWDYEAVCKRADTPEAALFAAAVALMEREDGNGNG